MAGRIGANASVKRFQRVMAILPERVAKRADAVLASQAASLAERIKAAAPADTGKLRNSVKVVKGRKPLRYYVTAGGNATKRGAGTFFGEFRDAIAKSSNGKAAGLGRQGLYDYARAIEFGASGGHAPRPFFYVTYRRDRKSMRRYLASECAKALKDEFNNG